MNTCVLKVHGLIQYSTSSGRSKPLETVQILNEMAHMSSLILHHFIQNFRVNIIYLVERKSDFFVKTDGVAVLMTQRRHCIVSLSMNINPSLVLVQPRKTRPYITERLLMGRKESKQTNKQNLSEFTPFYHIFRYFIMVLLMDVVMRKKRRTKS